MHSYILLLGVVVGTSSKRGSTGSKYLCLPVNSTVNESISQMKEKNTYMYGTLLDLSTSQDSSVFKQEVPGFHLTLCSVCDIHLRSHVIMIPGKIECPVGWIQEYIGYIMGQKSGRKRTEFLCIDQEVDANKISNTLKRKHRALTLLNFVETKCAALPCLSTGYQQYAELSCVLCSK